MRKTLVMLFPVCCVLLVAITVCGQKYKQERINATTASEGEKIRGPRSIKPVSVNRIRYRVTTKTKATFTPGPSLAIVPIIPQLPKQDTAKETVAAAKPRPEVNALIANIEKRTNTPDQQFQEISDLFNDSLAFKTAEIINPINDRLSRTRKAQDRVDGFVRDSDSSLAGANGPRDVLNNLPPLIQQIDNAKGDWPDAAIADFLGRMDIYENELDHISDVKWLVAHKDQVDALRAKIKSQREKVEALSHNTSDGIAGKFDKAEAVLAQWRDIFSDAVAAGERFFELPYIDVGCGGAFDQNKDTTVSLVKQDRLAADPKPEELELVTVFCSSPFSISGGFGFSTANEREFVFVPSIKTVTTNGQTTQTVINRFGFKNNSSFRPIPLLLLNTRVAEFNDDVALHLSAGAGVDIKTGQAGTDLEYIVGPSVSFKRSMFLTVGAHIARVPKLAGGFELDQEVPSGISEPPIEKAWKTGLIFAFTYKIK